MLLMFHIANVTIQSRGYIIYMAIIFLFDSMIDTCGTAGGYHLLSAQQELCVFTYSIYVYYRSLKNIFLCPPMWIFFPSVCVLAICVYGLFYSPVCVHIVDCYQHSICLSGICCTTALHST